jgi:hypothetical protein
VDWPAAEDAERGSSSEQFLSPDFVEVAAMAGPETPSETGPEKDGRTQLPESWVLQLARTGRRLRTPPPSRLPSVLLVLGLLFLLHALYAYRKTLAPFAGFIYVGIGLFLLMLAAFLVAARWWHERRMRARDDRLRADAATDEVLLNSLVDPELPPLTRALWYYCRRQIESCHEGTKARAAQSFLHAQVAAFVGLAVLVGGAVAGIIIFLQEPESGGVIPWITTGLGGLGAGLSTYIAGMHLATHRMSLNQLNYYFHQPVVTHQVLQAERLADALKDDTTTRAMLTQVTEALVDMARDVNTASLLLSQTDEPKRKRVMEFLRSLRKKKDGKDDGKKDGKEGDGGPSRPETPPGG